MIFNNIMFEDDDTQSLGRKTKKRDTRLTTHDYSKITDVQPDADNYKGLDLVDVQDQTPFNKQDVLDYYKETFGKLMNEYHMFLPTTGHDSIILVDDSSFSQITMDLIFVGLDGEGKIFRNYCRDIDLSYLLAIKDEKAIFPLGCFLIHKIALPSLVATGIQGGLFSAMFEDARFFINFDHLSD